MSKIFYIPITAFLFTMPLPAEAGLWRLDWGSGIGVQTGDESTALTNWGFDGDDSNSWNYMTGFTAPLDLFEDTGGTTITWSSDWMGYTGADGALESDFQALDTAVSGPITIIIEGLTGGGSTTYDLVLYDSDSSLSGDTRFDVDSDGDGVVDLIGGTELGYGSGNSAHYFSGLTPSGSGDILIKTESPSSGLISVAGFQIRAVPEPGTLSLAALALLGLCYLRRKLA